MTILVLLFMSMTNHCPKGWYLNGVHRDGTFVCREASGPERWDERNGHVPQEERREVTGHISCGLQTPVVVDWRTVGCLKPRGEI